MTTALLHAHYDNVKETTTSTGTGARVLSGVAPDGYRRLNATGIADTTVVPASIRMVGGTEYETGMYRYSTSGDSLTPVEIHSSSNSNAVVNFSSGTKEVVIGPIARHLPYPIPAWPFDSTQTVLRVNSILSTLTFSTRGLVTKITDISGNARDSSTNTTNPPKYLHHCDALGLPAIYYNLAHRHVFPGVPQKLTPLKICVYGIAAAWGVSGNSHTYNYAGNPIGFGATTPLDFVFNGSLPSGHADASAIVSDQRPDNWFGHPAAFVHIYDGASSINGINGVEQTVNLNIGTGSTGTTNSFTIGGDSSTGGGSYCRMALLELGVLDFSGTISATQKAQLWSYLRAMGRLNFI